MRKALLIGISTFALGAASAVGVSAFADAQSGSKAETYKMLELFGDVLTTVKRDYVVPVSDKKLIQAAIDGMLTSLDPHSGYLDPSNFSDMQDTTRGDYGGLGLVIQGEDGAVKIVSPMDNTPAAKAGLRAGDYITAIDGQSILGQPSNDAVKAMRGAVGTQVSLTIARDKVDPFTVKLTREVIALHTVSHHVEGDVGYLRVSGFDEKTGKETAQALRDLKAKIPHMKGVVLDLRNNPGGLVDSSVEVASAFLDGGEVVSQRGRDPRDIQRYNAKPNGDLIRGIPVVVMVNYGSASAAEIVAGALKDRGRATVVGLTSFGKGSVQTVLPLRGGADGAVKLTTAKYYTPSGGSIQKTGITPDLAVARSREEAQLISDQSVDFSEASYKNALDSQEGRKRLVLTGIEVPPIAMDPTANKEGEEKRKARLRGPDSVIVPGEQDNPREDFQLKRALEVLQYGGVRQTIAAMPAEIFKKPATLALNTAPAAPGSAVAAAKAEAHPAVVPAPAAAKPGAPLTVKPQTEPAEKAPGQK